MVVILKALLGITLSHSVFKSVPIQFDLVGVVVTQSVRIWAGGRRVSGSTPDCSKYGKWTAASIYPEYHQTLTPPMPKTALGARLYVAADPSLRQLSISVCVHAYSKRMCVYCMYKVNAFTQGLLLDFMVDRIFLSFFDMTICLSAASRLIESSWF